MIDNVLDRHTLILNKSWRAFTVFTVRDSIILMSRGSADGLCVRTSRRYSWEEWISDQINPPVVSHYIQGTSLKIPAPEVVVLNNYDDIHHKSLKFSSKAVYRRDNFTCQYCYQRKLENELSIDHITPKSKGGKKTWINSVTACKECNCKKSNRTPEEAGMKLLKLPTKPSWNPLIQIRSELRPDSWKPLIPPEW